MQVEIGATAEEIAQKFDVTLDAAVEQLEELELDGLVRKTGEYRNEWPVFVTTKSGSAEVAEFNKGWN